MAKETLTNTFCALTIILRHEKLEYVLNTPIPAQPAVDCTTNEVTMYNKHKEDELDNVWQKRYATSQAMSLICIQVECDP
jgi:hypothetical protein